jgi:hypothetical protein
MIVQSAKQTLIVANTPMRRAHPPGSVFAEVAGMLDLPAQTMEAAQGSSASQQALPEAGSPLAGVGTVPNIAQAAIAAYERSIAAANSSRYLDCYA